MSSWDKWSVLITRKSFACQNGLMWKHHCIFFNTSSRFAKFRKLAWGGAKGIRGGGIAPPRPPLATALILSKAEVNSRRPKVEVNRLLAVLSLQSRVFFPTSRKIFVCLEELQFLRIILTGLTSDLSATHVRPSGAYLELHFNSLPLPHHYFGCFECAMIRVDLYRGINQ